MRHLFTKNNVLFWISSMISIIIYLNSPKIYDYNFNLYCCIHFLFSVLLFFKKKRNKNYFNFETFFLFAFFCTFYLYPIFVYPIDPQYFFIFNYGFNENLISKATALSLVGSQFFLLGNISYKPIRKERSKIVKYNVSSIITFSIVFFALFLLMGGYSYYTDLYGGETTTQAVRNSGFLYMNMLFWVCLLLSLSLEMYRMLYLDKSNFRFRKVNKRLMLFICFYIPLLLSTGTRGTIIQTVLIIGGLYSLFYKPISLKLLLPFICLGCLGMFFISSTRGGGEFRIEKFMDMFMDLIINNRNTFVALEYVEENGYSYGISMLGYILRSIPFAQGIVFNTLGINPNITNSATILSIETLGDDPSFGVGTNIIADTYIAFGLFGVIIFMFIGGYFVSKVQYNASLYNLKYIVFYSVIISIAVYSVRAEFFFCLYLLVWSYVLLSFIKIFNNKKKTQHV